MALSFYEIPESRSSSVDPPSVTLKYKASGEPSDAVAGAYALGATAAWVSTPVGTLYRQNLSIDPDGYAQYIITVPYGPRPKDVGSIDFSFSTTGGTVTLKASKQTRNSYKAAGIAENIPDHKNAIGVTKDGIEGTEAVIPALRLSYTVKHPQGVANEAVARTLARNTGKVNSDTFRGFSAGELLFLGADGSDGTNSEASITYQFAASENITGLSIGDIANIAKRGHDYLWISFEPEENEGRAVQRPAFCYVERIYDEVSFASILGWS